VGKKVGRGDFTLLWDDLWVGDQPLRHKFPPLYGISVQKEGMITDLGRLSEGRWQCNISWQRERFQWEEDLYRELIEIITPFVPVENLDRWLWLVEEFVFKRLWKSAAPSKVCAFA
jgi:hypothetical protein